MNSNYLELFKDPTVIKAEVMFTLQECRDRCLHNGTKFLSELLVSLKDVPPFFDYENEDSDSIRFEFEPTFTNLEDYLMYSKARAYFDLEDYPSCAHIAKNTNKSETMFLHYMARYLCMHNENIYDRINIFEVYKPLDINKFMDLLNELLILNVYGGEDDSEEEFEHESQLHEMSNNVDENNSVQQIENESTPKSKQYSRRPCSQRTEKTVIINLGEKNKTTKRNNKTKKVDVASTSQSEMNTSDIHGDHKKPRIKAEDPYLLWLTAVMLKKIDRCDEAVDLLVRAIRIQPCHWGAWTELSTLVKSISMFDELNSRITDTDKYHWMHLLFTAQVFIDFQMIDEAVDIYNDILNLGHVAFKNWPYLHSQLAIAHHNKREITNSIVSFTNVIQLDPYRIDHFDLLSNLMYVCESHEEMAIVSKYVESIDRYRQETLCVIGNMYSLKSNHSKSILYFKNAVRMNPFNVTAWTLLGHDYMELKNYSAAILSYRQALKINTKDYRAWYGLGQMYETVKLPNFALFYIEHAHKLKPKDFRLLLTLGEMYERYDHTYEGLICCYVALQYDTDESSLIKLAKFYEKYSDPTTRDNFHKLNKTAMKIAFKNNSDEDLDIILSKIYLYLAYHYMMDLHYYERAVDYAERCRYLFIEMEKPSTTCLEILNHAHALIKEVETREGSANYPVLTQGPIRVRRFLFAL